MRVNSTSVEINLRKIKFPSVIRPARGEGSKRIVGKLKTEIPNASAQGRKGQVKLDLQIGLRNGPFSVFRPNSRSKIGGSTAGSLNEFSRAFISWRTLMDDQ